MSHKSLKAKYQPELQKHPKIFLILSFIIVTILMFVLNKYTPMYLDDFRYIYSWDTGEKIVSISQIIPSMRAHYQTMNGRTVDHILATVFLMINSTAFDIINSVAFSLFILIITYHSCGSFKEITATKFLFAALLVWICTPAFGEDFLWLTGSANYLFGPLICFAFLIPYTHYFFQKSNHSRTIFQIFFSVLFFAFGIIAGETNENMSLCLIIAQILFILSYIIIKAKLKPWMFTGILGNIIGAIILFRSPAYMNRSNIWSGKGSLYSMLSRFIVEISSFLNSIIKTMDVYRNFRKYYRGYYTF